VPLAPPALMETLSDFAPRVLAEKFKTTVQDAPAARVEVQVLVASLKMSIPLRPTYRAEIAAKAVMVIVSGGAARPTGMLPRSMADGDTSRVAGCGIERKDFDVLVRITVRMQAAVPEHGPPHPVKVEFHQASRSGDHGPRGNWQCIQCCN